MPNIWDAREADEVAFTVTGKVVGGRIAIGCQTFTVAQVGEVAKNVTIKKADVCWKDGDVTYRSDGDRTFDDRVRVRVDGRWKRSDDLGNPRGISDSDMDDHIARAEYTAVRKAGKIVA